MRRLFFHSPKTWGVSLLLGVLLTALGLFFRKSFLLIWWSDSLSIAGAVLVLLGLLGLVARLGAFDTVAYGFSTFGKRRYKDLFEYTQAKAEKRSHAPPGFMPLIAVGVLFLAAGILLRTMVH